jgi:hypothetical protein
MGELSTAARESRLFGVACFSFRLPRGNLIQAKTEPQTP